MKKIHSSEEAYQMVKRAMRLHRPVTITYTRANGSETIRTIEPYTITRNANGDRYVRAMDRSSGESRTFRLDRMSYLTEHRTAFRVPVPEPKSDKSRAFAALVGEEQGITVPVSVRLASPVPAFPEGSGS